MIKRKYKIEGCFMDDAHKFAFIHIYKNASISLRNILKMRGKYHVWNDVKEEKPITICIIRDPGLRCISAYLYLLRLEDNGRPDQHPVEITKETDFYKNKDNIEESFDQFLDYIEENGFYDAVTLPQVDFLRDRGLSINDIDEILIQDGYDGLSFDFEQFRKKYNLPEDLKIPSDNQSPDHLTQILIDALHNDSNRFNRVFKLYTEDEDMYMNILASRCKI